MDTYELNNYEAEVCPFCGSTNIFYVNRYHFSICKNYLKSWGRINHNIEEE